MSYLGLTPPQTMRMELILELPLPIGGIHQMIEQLETVLAGDRMRMSRIGPTTSFTNSNTRY